MLQEQQWHNLYGTPERQILFLNEMFGGLDCYIKFMCVDGERIIRYEKTFTTKFQNELYELNHKSKKFNVFYSVCGRNKRSGIKEYVSVVPALWVDIDRIDLPTTEHDPTFIVPSGHGHHLYWLLDKPFYINNDADRIGIEAILRGLAQSCNADTAFDVSRLLRLPETANWKNPAKPTFCYIHAVNIENGCVKRYPLSAFEHYAVESPVTSNIAPIKFDRPIQDIDIDKL
jgi:hypothetical protein